MAMREPRDGGMLLRGKSKNLGLGREPIVVRLRRSGQQLNACVAHELGQSAPVAHSLFKMLLRD
jgi:hypothetical protein